MPAWYVGASPVFCWMAVVREAQALLARDESECEVNKIVGCQADMTWDLPVKPCGCHAGEETIWQ
ncbi:MAG: hypothetical protein KatS3mg110_2118 [Pirellulaceae bacterium]|nr:MAG: hypothetical protein KatS3mg110_2118 [Pirellulaceae bacterium]